MGKLEEENRKRVRRGEIQKLILNSVKIAGVLSIGLVAPQVIGAMGKLGLIPNKRQEEIVRSSASKLVKKGLLIYKDGRYELAQEGEKKLRQWELQEYKFNRPEKWDKKWRVIIFDIPEKKKKVRNQIRNLFILAGLSRLQDSVWVYPYDCEDIVGLLKTNLGVGGDLLYMIVDEIENDKHLREEFDLL
ncbi:MAG: CRISPR-associated endonuclease Cas2 [bacterium]|nr:CRISPR-associated endonuclease Cas2 [bacterium]